MALPTGTITMAQVAAELGIAATGLSLNDSRVRALAGRPSGTISMNDLRGKSSIPPFAFVPDAIGSNTESVATAIPSISASKLTISFVGESGRYTVSVIANVGASEVLSNFEYQYNDAVRSSKPSNTWIDLSSMWDDIYNFNMIGDILVTVRRKGTTTSANIEVY